MSKDRNTFAKRQREMDKKRKADQKRERRAQQKQRPTEPDASSEPPGTLTQGEQSVLTICRNHQMKPGETFRLANEELKTFDRPIDGLLSKGFLVAEQGPGGFSLTEAGIAAMRDCE